MVILMKCSGKTVLGSLAAGMVNGLLGTGGGTVLFLTHTQRETPQKYTQSMIVALVGAYSAVGAAFRGSRAAMPLHDIVLLLLGSAAGAVLGCAFLGGVDGKYIKLVFSVLLIASGVRMLI